MLRNIIFLCLCALVLLPLTIKANDAQDEKARRLITSVDQRYRGDSWVMDSNVVLIDKNKRRTERSIRVKGKIYGRDEKTLTYVLSPARIRGTGILSYNWDDTRRENESWLFLPDLGKVTRLTTANRADYFLGTDFTYGDLEGLAVEDFLYRFDHGAPLAADELALFATPIDDKTIDKYGYKKIRYWVDTKRYVINKAQYWLKDNGWMKYYRQFDFQRVDGVWLADREQMLMTHQGQVRHTTLVIRGNVEIYTHLDDGLFTASGLERAGQ